MEKIAVVNFLLLAGPMVLRGRMQPDEEMGYAGGTAVVFARDWVIKFQTGHGIQCNQTEMGHVEGTAVVFARN